LFWRSLTALTSLLLAGLLAGCADTQYYWQSVAGHWQLMQAAKPVGDWLADPQAPAALKQRLALAQDIRHFAVTELHLPDNASYQRYADVQRPSVVWNVVAAPEFSLTLKTWCFPVAGCVGYRGYFAQADALAQAQSLRRDGYEASVYGVPAYSTLGWTNWLGGDPLLNTFIHYPDGELARMVFHELAHQVLYVPDDTVFNESFATAVERLGGVQWLRQRGSSQAQLAYAELDARLLQFRALTRATRQRLAEVYKENSPLAHIKTAQVVIKKEAFSRFLADYESLKKSWGGYSGYDNWVAQANNASFGALAAYDELVPGFEALFERQGRDWPRFYDAVKQLSHSPAAQRAQQLKQWTSEQHG
jgi:predicted aminopeptidase